MGLRSPQEMQKVGIRQEASTRFQGAVAPKIDTQYINTFSKMLARKEQEQIEFVKYGMANEADKERVKAQASVANAQGPAALTESEKQRADLEKNLNKKLELIPEHLRRHASAEAQKSLAQYDSFATPYAYAQVKKTQDEVLKTRIANDMNNIAEVSGNPEALGANLQTLTETITSRAMRPYRDMDPDQEVLGTGMTVRDIVDSEVKIGTSKSLAKAIESQIGAGQIPIAKTILQNHNDKLLPNERNKILKAFKKAEEKQQTRTPLDLATYAMAEAGDDLTAADEILTAMAPDTKTYDSAAKILRSKTKIAKQEIDLRDDKTLDILTQKVNKGQYPTAEELNQISDYAKRVSFVDAINRSQGSLGTITIPSIKQDLLNKMSRATPEEAAKINLPSYKLYLGSADYAMIESLQLDLFKKDANGRLKASQSDFREVRSMIGVLAKEKKLNKAQTEQLESLAMNEYQRVRDTNPNYQTSDIKKSVYNRIAREGFQTEKGFWSDTTKIAKSVDPLQGKQVHTSWRNLIRTKYKNLSEDAQNKLMLELINRHGEDALAKPLPIAP